MAVRTDVDVLYYLDPRVVLVRAPSTSISVQDLHDTLREIEDEPANIRQPGLIKTDGKQSLGGSLSVGLTAELQNAVLGFQGFKGVIASGAITSTDPTGETLVDSSADFVGAGVAQGDSVFAVTDGSIATALQVIDANTVRTDSLGAGTSDSFAAGQSYRIYRTNKVEVSGGNLVAVDSNGQAIESVIGTVGNFLARTLSTSATLLTTGAGGSSALTRAVLSTVLDGSRLHLLGWLERDGSLVANPISASVTFWDLDGTSLFTANMGTADANGVFRVERDVSILMNRVYYADLTITDATGARTDRVPQQSIKVK